MPRLIIYSVMVLLMLALIPPVVAARVRASPSPNRPIHIIQDMDIQAKFKPQTLNPIYADQRAMRPEVVGAVARGDLPRHPHLENGVVDGGWATSPRRVRVISRRSSEASSATTSTVPPATVGTGGRRPVISGRSA